MQQAEFRLLPASHLDPDDGSDMFLQDVDSLSADYMALYPRNRTLQSHSCENLKLQHKYITSTIQN
jgi:hypothetical protein